MRQRTHVSSRGAFTLVELLVVIGIIAILISILLPALNRARDKARSVQCMSNMRQIYIYCAMFAQDNKGRLPRPGINDPPSPDVDRTTPWAQDGPGLANFTSGCLWKYIPAGPTRQQIILCPGDNGEQVRYGSLTTVAGEGRNFSYSMNSNVSDPRDASNPAYFGIPLGVVKDPARHILWFEEIGPNDCWCLNPQGNWDDTPSGRHGGQKALNATRAEQGPGQPGYDAWLKAGRGNHCFFDGHVESLPPGAIMDPKATYWAPLRDAS